MSETTDRIAELKAASAAAKKQGPVRESLSIPSDRSWDSPFSGVRLKDVFASRKAASDKLENLREEETEALQQREAKGKKMAKGGAVRGWGMARGARKAKIV
jgi:hypothetical protein